MKNLVTNLVTNSVNHRIWWQIRWQIWWWILWVNKFGDELGDKYWDFFGDKFCEKFRAGKTNGWYIWQDKRVVLDKMCLTWSRFYVFGIIQKICSVFDVFSVFGVFTCLGSPRKWLLSLMCLMWLTCLMCFTCLCSDCVNLKEWNSFTVSVNALIDYNTIALNCLRIACKQRLGEMGTAGTAVKALFRFCRWMNFQRQKTQAKTPMQNKNTKEKTK